MTARGTSTLPSICFVAPQAWAVLARDRSLAVVGGAEVQQATLARELARRGHAVTMVCLDYGQPDGVVVDGVRVLRAYRPGEGLPVLRFIHPRLTKIWAAMRRADAQIYYQRNSGALTAWVSAFARQHGRIAIYAGASDSDFDPALPLVPYARDKALYRWGARHADAIVTQTPAQAVLCRAMFSRESTIIRSAYAAGGRPGAHGGPVLWVGTIKPIKGPEAFVDLARACPELRFRMVGGGDPSYVQSIKARAVGLTNLEFTGFVPHADVEVLFDAASVLVNTSPAEGFPNTFLQAWSRGIPSLSFFDPQFERQGRAVGATVKSVEEMAQVLRRWKGDASAWRQAGEDCRATFESTFGVASAVDRYEALFRELLQPRTQGVTAGSVQP
jgi:glycosyltransferase involved in cell wall biosynthesis